MLKKSTFATQKCLKASFWGIYPTKRQQSMATSCHFISRSCSLLFSFQNFVLVSFCKHLCCSHIFLVGRAGGLAFLFWICTLYVCVNTHTHTACTYLSLTYNIYIYIIYTSCTSWSKQTISIFRCPLPTVAFKKYYLCMPMVSINNTTEKQPTIWSHRKSCYAKKLRELIAGWGLLG